MKHKFFSARSPLFFVVTIITVLVFLGSSFALALGWFTDLRSLEGDPCIIGSTSGITLSKQDVIEVDLSFDDQMKLLGEINEIDPDSRNIEMQKLEAYIQDYTSRYLTESEDDFDEDENEQKSNIGKLVLITYELNYKGNDMSSVEAYVRFNPNNNIKNAVTIDGKNVICYSDVFYLKNRKHPIRMNRIWSKDNSAFYYPWSISNGDSVSIIYALYFPEADDLPDDLSDLDLKVESAFAQNNAAMLKWNIMFYGNVVVPFKESKAVTPDYIEYSVDLQKYLLNPEEVEEEVENIEGIEDVGEQGEPQGTDSGSSVTEEPEPPETDNTDETNETDETENESTPDSIGGDDTSANSNEDATEISKGQSTSGSEGADVKTSEGSDSGNASSGGSSESESSTE